MFLSLWKGRIHKPLALLLVFVMVFALLPAKVAKADFADDLANGLSTTITQFLARINANAVNDPYIPPHSYDTATTQSPDNGGFSINGAIDWNKVVFHLFRNNDKAPSWDTTTPGTDGKKTFGETGNGNLESVVSLIKGRASNDTNWNATKNDIVTQLNSIFSGFGTNFVSYLETGTGTARANANAKLTAIDNILYYGFVTNVSQGNLNAASGSPGLKLGSTASDNVDFNPIINLIENNGFSNPSKVSAALTEMDKLLTALVSTNRVGSATKIATVANINTIIGGPEFLKLAVDLLGSELSLDASLVSDLKNAIVGGLEYADWQKLLYVMDQILGNGTLANPGSDDAITTAIGLVDKVFGTAYSVKVKAAYDYFKEFAQKTAYKLNEYSVKLKSDQLTAGYIIDETEKILKALEEAILYVGGSELLGVFDQSDITAIKKVFSEILPYIKNETLRQLEPWRVDETGAHSGNGWRDDSWLYINTTDAANNHVLNLAGSYQSIINSMWVPLENKIGGLINQYFQQNSDKAAAKSIVSAIIGPVANYVQNYTLSDLDPGSFWTVTVWGLVNQYLYQYQNVPVANLADGVENRMNDLFKLLGVSNDDIKGLIGNGAISGLLLDGDNGTRASLSSTANMLLAAVYRQLAKEAAVAISDTAMKSYLAQVQQLQQNAYDIASYVDTNKNVDILKNGADWATDTSEPYNGMYVYSLPSGDELNTDYDTLIWNNGYSVPLEKFGVTFQYRLVNQKQNSVPMSAFKIDGNKIVIDDAASLDPQHPYTATVQVYAVIRHTGTTTPTNYRWDVLLAEKAIGIKYSVTVTFNTNGGSDIPEVLVASGETVAKPDDPTKPDSTFQGWYSDPGLTTVYDFDAPVTADITLYAKWVEDIVVPATVDFDTNGGTPVVSQTVAIGGKATKPTDPIKDGFTFDGWYSDQDLTTVYDFDTPVPGDITIYAKWAVVVLGMANVIFNTNGGTAVESQTVAIGGKATKPADPARADHTFDGWYSDEGLTTLYNFDDIVTGDITIYAKWVAVLPGTATVAFDTNGGTLVDSQTIAIGGKAAKPADPTKDGFTFDGWYSDSGLNTLYEFDDPVDGDITIYAKWVEALPGTVTVTFDTNGGTLVDSQSVTIGEKAARPANPTRTGFTFEGWYSNSGLTTLYDFSDTVTNDITIYAKWVEDTVPTLTATVDFDTNGGTLVDSQTVTIGEKAARPDDPTKTGYIFDGWFTSLGFDTLYDFDDPVIGDITIYAKWLKDTVQPGTATITFNSNGGTAVSSQTVAIGGKIRRPANPSLTGYTFAGWHYRGALWDFNSGTVSGDMTLTAHWNANPNPVYAPNGNVSPPSVVIPGGSPATPAPGAALPGGPPVNSRPATIGALRAIAPSLANELYKLGLLAGTGVGADGLPTFELSRPLNRIEALAIVVRLLGLEKAANASTAANPFKDVPAWADRIAAYAYGAGITVGVNGAHTLFDPARPVTYQEFTAFLLRVLQYYEKAGDFAYADALQKGISIGLYSPQESAAQRGASEYLRSDAVVAMLDALLTNIKGGGSRLIEKLVSDGVLGRDAAGAFIAAVNRLYQVN